MKVIIWRKDRVEYILSGLCRYYKIDRYTLIKKRQTREGTKRKRIAIKLLKDVADISIPEIGRTLNFAPPGIYGQYKNITMDVSPDTYGNKELKREYLEILDYLKL